MTESDFYSELITEAEARCENITTVGCTPIVMPFVVPEPYEADSLENYKLLVGTHFEEHFDLHKTLTESDFDMDTVEADFPNWSITINPEGEAPALCLPTGLYAYEFSAMFYDPDPKVVILQRGKFRVITSFRTEA